MFAGEAADDLLAALVAEEEGFEPRKRKDNLFKLK